VSIVKGLKPRRGVACYRELPRNPILSTSVNRTYGGAEGYIVDLSRRVVLTMQNVPPERTMNNMAAEEPDAQTQITLHYIDKMFEARQRLASGAQRFLVFATVLAFIVLATSGGAAYTEQALSVSGVGLRVPFTMFLTFGAIVVGIVTVSGSLCDAEAQSLDMEIQRLYKSIGFEDRTLYANIASPFRGANSLSVLASIFSREDYQYGEQREAEGLYSAIKAEFLLIVIVLIIPTAAQVAAGFKVSEIVQQAGLGWVWMCFVLLAVGTSTLAFLHVWHEPFFGVFDGPQLDDLTKVQRLGLQSFIIGIQVVIGAVIALPGMAIGFFVTNVLGNLLAS
jgi:hypothetical protein